MALSIRGSLFKRNTERRAETADDAAFREFRRMEEKQKSLAEATQKWLALLREMEQEGRSGEARYESYYQAYLQAKQRQKIVDLQLFNLRRGLVS